jgi:membrane peptidoglycan carboxypeptidase
MSTQALYNCGCMKNLLKKIKLPNIKTIWGNFKAFLKKNSKWVKMVLLAGFVGLLVYIYWGIPLPTRLTSDAIPVSSKILDRNGKLIFEIYTDQRRTPIKVGDLPKYVIDATIAIEDKDFYKHHGISITGIARAAYNTIFKGKLQGGSTLSQQLVKNSLLTQERTVKRKIREFTLTMVVESMYSKEKILTVQRLTELSLLPNYILAKKQRT